MTFDFPHDVPGDEQCPGEGVEIEMEWNRYIPASQWEPAEGGHFSFCSGLPETCPTCERAYTAAELKDLEAAALVEAACQALERREYGT